MKENALVIYKTWKSEYKLVICMIVGMFLSIFLSKEFPKSVIQGDLFSIGEEIVNLSLPIFWLIPLGFFLVAVIKIYNVRYALNAKGLEMTVGILSMKKRTVKIRYEDIRSIETQQTIIERMLNIGTVEIGTSSTGSIEIVFEGVDSPQELLTLVQKEKGRRIALKSNSQGYVSND